MDASELSFFRAEGGELVPLPMARSGWSTGQIHGVATSGALARAAEQCLSDAGRGDLRPARVTVDLFRPAAMAPCRFETSVVREGPRLCLVDTRMLQADGPVARSSTLFLKPTEQPPGEVWSPTVDPEPPPVEEVPPSEEPRVPWLHSDGVGWSQDFRAHQNGGRKRMWQCLPPVVADEEMSTFVALAAVADSTSMVTSWSTSGVSYINTDITFSVARLPASVEIGLEASDHTAYDGVAVGTATLFDRRGRFGTSTVTSVANARRTVDFADIAERTAPDA